MIPKHMERSARLIVLACLAVVLLGAVIGLLWMSTYAVK